MTDPIIQQMQEKARANHFVPNERDDVPVIELYLAETLIATAVRAGYEARDREVREIISKVLETFIDKGDERYGWVKHNNTVLQRIEDDLLTHLNSKV